MDHKATLVDSVRDDGYALTVEIEGSESDSQPFLIEPLNGGDSLWVSETDVKTIIKVLQQALRERKRLTS